MDPPQKQDTHDAVETVLSHSNTSSGRLYAVRRMDDIFVELPAHRVPRLALTWYYHRRCTRTAKPPGRG